MDSPLCHRPVWSVFYPRERDGYLQRFLRDDGNPFQTTRVENMEEALFALPVAVSMSGTDTHLRHHGTPGRSVTGEHLPWQDLGGGGD